MIDDERFILDIFSQFLCGEGYNVQSVQSNDDAIQYLKKKTYINKKKKLDKFQKLKQKVEQKKDSKQPLQERL